MTAFGWRSGRPVAEWLFAEPWGFDFFQAVRLLEEMRPEATPLGEGSDPQREAVRFVSRVALEFAASDIYDLREAEEAGAPPVMSVAFLGLAGLQGPLPRMETERIIERVKRGDKAFRDFLDIFNHRLAALTVRARKAHAPALTGLEPQRTPLAARLRSFFGMGLAALEGRLGVDDRALLHYAGILAQRPRSASGLERLLADYFNVAAAVRQLVGRWREIEPEQRTAIGESGRNQQLGCAVLGARYWDQQGGLEIELGPLHLASFLDLLPEGDGEQAGSGYQALCELTRFYVGVDCEYSFRLVLAAGEVPAARLAGAGERGARLGWTSWLKTRPFEADDRQVTL